MTVLGDKKKGKNGDDADMPLPSVFPTFDRDVLPKLQNAELGSFHQLQENTPIGTFATVRGIVRSVSHL